MCFLNFFKANNYTPLQINVRDFIFANLTPYDGDEKFLKGPTDKTTKLWEEAKKLLNEERNKGGVLDIDTKTISTITSHGPGYLNKDLELIVGFQTDAPLKRSIKPFGGYRIVEEACEQNGYKLDPQVIELCQKYRKTHNDGVFSAYTEEMRNLRRSGILTGLPDNYGRGRIIGDYRRLALYGIDELVKAKEADRDQMLGDMTNELIRDREEISEQIKALFEIKEMAASYGHDVSKPATNAREAIQWTYFAFLAAVKEHYGAAMSLGNVSGFFDIYLEKDLKKVTKTSYRFLQTLYNLGPAPEPNLTVFGMNVCQKVSKNSVPKFPPILLLSNMKMML